MDRVSTTVRMDRATRDLLDVIGKARGVAINALVNRAITAFVDREAQAIEQDLNATLTRLRTYRSKTRDHSAAIRAVVESESSLSDPAEADRLFEVKGGGVERSVLAILDDEA